MAESYSRRMVYTRVEETVYFRSSRTVASPPVVTQRARRPQPPSVDATSKSDIPEMSVETPSAPQPISKGEVTARTPPTSPHELEVNGSAPKGLTAGPASDTRAVIGNVDTLAPVKMASPAIAAKGSNAKCGNDCLKDLGRSTVAKFQTLVITVTALSRASVGEHVDGAPGVDGISIVSDASPGKLLAILQAVARSSETHGKVRGYPPPPCNHKSRLILTEASNSCTAYIVSVVPHRLHGVTFNFVPIEEASVSPGIRAAGVITNSRVPRKCLSPVRISAAIAESPSEVEFNDAPESTAMVLRPAGTMQVGFAPLSSLKFN